MNPVYRLQSPSSEGTGERPLYSPTLRCWQPDFPPPREALSAPEGLLAIGGQITPEWLLHAYAQGIFPWSHADEPLLWWSPDPRCVLFPDHFKASRSLNKNLDDQSFEITFNSKFENVIQECAAPTPRRPHTWITTELMQAWCTLHRQGHACSVEVWQHGQLVGGLYGMATGQVYCGESMFSRVANASGLALAWLVRHLDQQGCTLIDCQLPSAHLQGLGATLISRERFLALLPGSQRDMPPAYIDRRTPANRPVKR